MAGNRYDEDKLFNNKETIYRKILERRGMESITHYGKTNLNKIEQAEIASLQTIPHIWSATDKMYKLSSIHYGSTDYWWVIAWFNQTPMDSFLRPGDKIFIPMPLEQALYYAKNQNK